MSWVASWHEGNHSVRKSLPCTSEDWRCYMCYTQGWTCSMLTSLVPNAHHWSPLSKAGTVPIRPLGCPCMAIHIFFLFYFPLRQCQVLIQCWANRSQQDTLHCVYLGIMKSPTSELASSDPLLSHLCSSPPCLTDRISSSDNSVGTRS